MNSDIASYEILLASDSPRRAALMHELGLPFRVVETAHSNEDYPPELEGGDIARFLADHKSDAYTGTLLQKQVLLTADTIVWQEGKELGKPANREEALAMISSLSGQTHQVYTGVCLRSASKRFSFYVATDVTFSRLEDEELNYYVDEFKPYDKAGAYGIQEWIGHVAVESINGSYFNVMGLPLACLYDVVNSLLEEL